MKVETSIIDEKTGKYKVIDMPDPEPEPIFWHPEQAGKKMQVVISEEKQKEFFHKKQLNDLVRKFPKVSALFDYVKNLTVPVYIENGILYFYLDAIFESDYKFLLSEGIEINGEVVFEI